MTKRKILYALTLTLPTAIYLLVYALIFSITPDLTIDDDIANLSVVTYGDEYFIYGDNQTQYIGGYVVYNEDVIGAVIDNDDVIKIGWGYYSYVADENGVYALTNIKDIKQTEEQGWQIPISLVISGIAIAIVVMIMLGKFDAIKKRPYVSVLVSLWLGTGVLYIVSFITNNMLGVFLMASISWTIFMIEKKYNDGKLTQQEKNKTESDLMKQLKELIDNE